MFSLRDVEPDVLLCLLSPEARCDRGGGQLREPSPGTVSFTANVLTGIIICRTR